MKRLLYILPIILFACGQTNNRDKVRTSMDSAETKEKFANPNSDTISLKKEATDLDSLRSLEIFSSFALSYSPIRKPNSGIAILPETPDSVLAAIKIVKTSLPKEFEKYLTLIFVKLYSAHLECCHQSYEVRKELSSRLDKESDPLVYEFNILTKMYPNDKPIEFISSSIGYDYVKTHTYLLNFKPIKKSIFLIEQVQKNIEDGVYWK